MCATVLSAHNECSRGTLRCSLVCVAFMSLLMIAQEPPVATTGAFFDSASSSESLTVSLRHFEQGFNKTKGFKHSNLLVPLL